ncbi:hypothetical protein KIL84_011165, partial [Mauremys mutica]
MALDSDITAPHRDITILHCDITTQRLTLWLSRAPGCSGGGMLTSSWPRPQAARDVTPSSAPLTSVPEGAGLKNKRFREKAGAGGDHELDSVQDWAAQETDCTQD